MKKTIEYIFIGVLGLIIIAFLILSIPFAIISAPFNYLSERKFEKKFKQFLNSIEGKNFFVYNNRKKSCVFIEKEVLAKLPKNIEVLYIENRKVIKNENQDLYSTLIYRVKNFTKFPHLIKIRNGKIEDISINQELFVWKNQSKISEQFFDLLNVFFELEKIKEK